MQTSCRLARRLATLILLGFCTPTFRTVRYYLCFRNLYCPGVSNVKSAFTSDVCPVCHVVCMTISNAPYDLVLYTRFGSVQGEKAYLMQLVNIAQETLVRVPQSDRSAHPHGIPFIWDASLVEIFKKHMYGMPKGPPNVFGWTDRL